MNHSNELLWRLAYHLAGPTILGRTRQEPLGSLPVPVRTAVLKTASNAAPDLIRLSDRREESLKFSEGEYEWVDGWYCLDDALLNLWTTYRPSQMLPRYLSVEDYFREHNLRPEDSDQEDEHYAERFFV